MRRRHTNFFQLLRALVRRARCFLPSRLPVGLTEFNAWADRLIQVYKLPDNESIRFSIATVVLHDKPQAFYRPMEFYGRTLLKACANQVAAHVLHEMKERQRLRIEAEKKQAEVTATKVEAVESEPVQVETLPS